jgi:hypothetical protein
VTKKLDVILQYTSTPAKFIATGTMNADASAGSGSWDCYPVACAGPFTWSTTRVVPVTGARILAADGGTIIDDLGNTLEIPTDSLCGDTSIEVQMIPRPSNEPSPPGVAVLSRAFVGSPDGTRFDCGLAPDHDHATVTIHYTLDDIANGTIDPSALRAMVWDPTTMQWLYVGGTVDTVLKTITFPITDFTDYAFFDCLTGLTDTDGDKVGDVCDTDDDNDGCSDVKEPALTLDPLYAWDFYSVPVPSLFAAPNPLVVFRDSAVSASDAQAVFAYFKAGAKTGQPEYEQDLNANGIKDGVEYDRTVVGPGKSGPPDGVVSASDAQLAFAQFKAGYHC